MSNAGVPATTNRTSTLAAMSSERLQWQRIFATLAGMLQNQESQIETLVDDRKFLEDYVHLQHNKWVCKTHLLQLHISQLKEEEEIWKRAQEAKFDVLLGLKEKEVEWYREHVDLLKSDLDDFYDCIVSLCQQNKELKKEIEHGKKERRDCSSIDEEERKRSEEQAASLEGKLRKLQQELKILSSKKESEISALVAEKDFIWHQFKQIDEDYTSLRKSRHIEFEQANEAVEKLQGMVENLQSEVVKKDDSIANLRTTISELELNLGRCTGEVEQSNKKLVEVQSDLDELRFLVNEKNDTISKLRETISELELNLGRCTEEVEQSNKKLVEVQSDLDDSRILVNEKNDTISKLKDDLIKLQTKSLAATNVLSSLSEERAPSGRLRSSLQSSSGRSSSERYRSRSEGNLARKKETNIHRNLSRSSVSGKTKGLKPCSIVRKRPTPEETPKLFSGKFKVPKLKDLAFPLS